jgi:FlaG/FlaF family flagellin (archaellin)
MKKKILISVVAVVVLLAAVFAVIAVKYKSTSNGGINSYNSMEEAVKNAAFNMEYSDRLCGYPATDFKSSDSTVEVQYGSGGYIRKTLGETDINGESNDYAESNNQDINGHTVTCKGNDGLIYLAVWNDNNFTYTIKTNTGVSLDEMTEYIEATR